MSKVPVTPPEISSSEDTPPDSLLARLRQITGLTEAELPPPPPEKPVRQGPPVEQLMVALREITGVAAACGIAVAAALAVVVVWMWERTLEGRLYARRWQQPRAARKALRAPAEFPQPAAVALVEETESRVVPVLEVTAEKPAAEEVTVEDVAVEIARTDPAPGEIVETSPLLLKPRPCRWRRAIAGSAALLCGLSALLFIPGIRYSITGLLGWGNAAVVVGEDGWLFPRASSASGPGLQETASRLRAGGATLIVVNVPAKAAVCPEWLHASHHGGLEREPAVAAAQQKLGSAGALLLDLGPVLHELKTGGQNGEPVFRAQSSHWSPRGAERAAAAAAALVQQQPGYASLPLQPQQPSLVRHSLTAPQEDLAAAFDSARWRQAHPPQPLHFIRLLGTGHEPLASDPSSPVLLIGGDEVRIYDDPALTPSAESLPAGGRFSAGFAQYLAMYLSTRLEVQAADSSVAAAQHWLDSRTEAERRAKKFILWVVPDGEMAP